jgi:hypothetical protein
VTVIVALSWMLFFSMCTLGGRRKRTVLLSVAGHAFVGVKTLMVDVDGGRLRSIGASFAYATMGARPSS